MSSVNAPARAKQIVYDLLPDWRFWPEGEPAIRLDQLEIRAKLEPKLKGQVIMGDPLRTPPATVLVNISGEGLSLWDVKTRVTHRWKHAAGGVDLNQFAKALKAALSGQR